MSLTIPFPPEVVALAQKLAIALELPDHCIVSTGRLATAVFGPALTAFDALLRDTVPDLVAQAESFVAASQGEIVAAAPIEIPLLTPTTAVFCLVFYFATLIVLFLAGRVLPKLRVTLFSTLHNLFLTTLSFYMWAAILVTAIASKYPLWNVPMRSDDPNSWRMAKLVWIFYISKLPEFVDTFIMMLKQNYKQVSFLHVYHHCSIFTIWFFVTLIAPGGDAYFSAMLNSGIHVIMYGYYFLTAIFPEETAVRRFLNKFKFVITKGQMTQFGLNVLQSGYLLFILSDSARHYPKSITQLLFYYMFTLLALFGNFLIRNAGAAKAARVAKKESAPRSSSGPQKAKKMQ